VASIKGGASHNILLEYICILCVVHLKKLKQSDLDYDLGHSFY